MRFALLALTLLLAACTQPADLGATETQQPVEQETTAEQTAEEILPEEPVIAEESNFAVTLVLDEYSMTPSTITVPEGSTVQLTAENVGAVTHGLGILDFNVNEQLAPGETKTVTFVADKKGTFSFFCSVPCGSGHSSMRGTLIVE